MLAVTEQAKDALLRKKHDANIAEPEVGLRVAPDSAGEWVLFADRPRTDDQVIEHKGTTVLLIGADVSEILAGTKVDCLTTAEGGEELVLRHADRDDGRRA